jgi:polysaccharide export outer membrane protein
VAALPRELSEEVLSVYIVEPGDVLYLEAAKFDSPMRLPGDQTVQPDGSIELGKYGRLQVAGMTIPEIRDAVQAAVDIREESDWLRRAAERDNPSDSKNTKEKILAEREWQEAREVVVRLVDWKSKVFYVMGEVNSPGAYPFSGSENVLDALVAAGDITQRSDRHHIILSRPTGPCDQRLVLPICYDNLVQLGDSSSNYQILPGDRIFVPSISLCDDLVQSFVPGANERCPRCGPPQRGAPIPKVACSNATCRNCQ